MKDIRVILASGSPRRKQLLEQIGVRPEIRPSRIEEQAVSRLPEEVVMELSCQKAEDVAAEITGDALVLGADTVVAVDGDILGKPKSHEDAMDMVRRIQGRSHQVYTGVTLIYKKQGEMKRYADSAEPMDKAGAYGIQGAFAAYIEGIHGDYTNVVGLPVGRVCQEWKQLKEEMEDQDSD